MWKIHQNAQSLPLFPDPSSIGSEHLISLPYASLSALLFPEIKENFVININQMKICLTQDTTFLLELWIHIISGSASLN